MNSLSSKYDPFQMNYNAMKHKWNVHDLHSILVQQETRLKNLGSYSTYHVKNQGLERKLIRNMERENDH